MKVGDYVRTNLKDEIDICKVIDIIHSTSMNDNRMVFDKPTKFTYYVEDNKNYKSSPNITNLIEAGDVIKLEYDGNEYICDVYEYKGKANCLVVYCEDTIIPVKTTDERVELKSIVTKEQFESMEYKIGE